MVSKLRCIRRGFSLQGFEIKNLELAIGSLKAVLEFSKPYMQA